MDCRHAFCYNCLLGWFEAHGPTCPACRELTALPRRDFALSHITSWAFKIHGQAEPTLTSEGVDNERFKAVYQAAYVREEMRLQTEEVVAQWRAGQVEQGENAGEVITVDEDMIEVDSSSEWEANTEHGEEEEL